VRVALAYHAMRLDAGIPKMHTNLARFLVERGHEVHVYGNLADSAPSLTREVRFHDVGAPAAFGRLSQPWASARFMRCAGAMIRRDRPDVVHGRGVSAWRQDIVHVSGVYRAERAGHIGDGTTARSRSLLWPVVHPMGWLRAVHERHLARDDTLLFHAETPAVAEALTSSYGIVPARITVVVPGVDIHTFSPDGPRAELGLEPPVIAFCGHDYRRKGLETVLRAMTRMRTRAGLVVVGGGAHLAGGWTDRSTAPFERLAGELGLVDRVRFVGAQRDVAPYFRAAQVLAHPAQFDVWALAVTEAMASGLPVVVSSTTGASQLVDGANGMVLKRADDADELAHALDTLLDPRTRDSAAQRARATAEQVSVEHQGALVEADMERVVAAKLAPG
jgi:glycosyltransferase involved in cell wall biosynthesis